MGRMPFAILAVNSKRQIAKSVPHAWVNYLSML